MSFKVNPIRINPAFKGIVKVNLVFVNDKQTYDKKAVDSATKQLKEILMKKDKDSETLRLLLAKNNWDKPKTLTEMDENLKKRLTDKSIFRQIYRYFDKDYKIPEAAPKGDARDVFAKVRTGKYGNEVYLVSGKDATDIYTNGKNIGGKKALERVDHKKIGLADQAKEDYFSIKDEIAARYSRNPLKPSIYLYAVTDKKGIVRLTKARMENENNHVYAKNPSTQTVILNHKYVEETTETQKPKIKPEIKPAVIDIQPIIKPKEEQPSLKKLSEAKNQAEEEKNPILEELSTKNWDSVLLKKPKKRTSKKHKDAPGQQFFNF